jgi:hypothetical protein
VAAVSYMNVELASVLSLPRILSPHVIFTSLRKLHFSVLHSEDDDEQI